MHRVLIILTVLIASTCLGLCLEGCGRSSRPSAIRFTVPNGFRGIFVVTENTNASAPTVDAGGTYIISVPRSAQIIVNDTRFLEHIASMSAAYADGTVLPAEMLHPISYFSDTVALYIVTVDSEGTYYFFVGTDREMASIYHSRDYTLGGVPDE